MKTPRLEYVSFLVRLWREPTGSAEPPAADREWLVQVEHIPDGERHYFASLEDLFAYIRAQVAGLPADKGAGRQRSRNPERSEGTGAEETTRGDDLSASTTPLLRSSG